MTILLNLALALAAALLVTALFLGVLFWRMCGSIDSCMRVYAAWRAQEDERTDQIIRRGMREAKRRGWLMRDCK